jgi:hypothetical protein
VRAPRLMANLGRPLPRTPARRNQQTAHREQPRQHQENREPS